MTATPPHPTPGMPRPAVVLLHASGSSARQWDRLADALAATHEVHALDLHGHGRRAPWPGPQALSLHDDAQLVLDVLERTGPAQLVGHSYGGAVALHVAAMQPQRVRRLALYEPALFSLLVERAPASDAAREVGAVAARLRQLVGARRPADAAATFVDYWSGPGSWVALGADRQRSVTARIGASLAHFDALMREPVPAAAPQRLTMPVLVMCGERTIPAARALAALVHAFLPAARHEAVAGIGHMGPIVDPARVNRRLLHFLDARAPSPADTAAAIA